MCRWSRKSMWVPDLIQTLAAFWMCRWTRDCGIVLLGSVSDRFGTCHYQGVLTNCLWPSWMCQWLHIIRMRAACFWLTAFWNCKWSVILWHSAACFWQWTRSACKVSTVEMPVVPFSSYVDLPTMWLCRVPQVQRLRLLPVWCSRQRLYPAVLCTPSNSGDRRWLCWLV